MTLPLSAPASTVIVAFLSCDRLIGASLTTPLALDPHPALDAAQHVVGQAIDKRGIERRSRGGCADRTDVMACAGDDRRRRACGPVRTGSDLRRRGL